VAGRRIRDFQSISGPGFWILMSNLLCILKRIIDYMFSEAIGHPSLPANFNAVAIVKNYRAMSG
jgi:hypothetical protein